MSDSLDVGAGETQATHWYRGDSRLGNSVAAAYERYLVPAIFALWARELVGLAAPAPGERVLDVACGTGVVARLASERVGSTGSVTGLDLNPDMLTVARSLPWATAAPVAWQEASALQMPFPVEAFDLVLCQQGLQFFANRLVALVEMQRVLVPGGRVGLSVWRPIECSPGFAALDRALARHIGPEATVRPPFALGDAETLRDLAAEAGFRSITVRPAIRTLRFPSAEEFVRRYAAATPLAAVLKQMDGAVRAALVDDVRSSLAAYTSEGTLAFPIETHLVLAQKPYADAMEEPL